MRVADYIINKLYQEQVEHIFMVTGRGALFLTDAVAAHKKIKAISVHHEQSAAYAAVAYSNYSENLGACLVSTGCASTNAITGVLNAWQDGIPCIFISGQNKLNETSRYTGIPLRTYGQQEADIIEMVSSITKYSVMITDPKKAVYEIEKAFYFAKEGRKGPVWIDIPLDVQNMRIEPEELEHFSPPTLPAKKISKEEIEYLIHQLNTAQRPSILIGSGIRSADAIDDFRQFVKKYNIPVTYSSSATDTYGIGNDMSFGSVGIMGCTRSGNFTVQNSDFVLVLGSRLSSMTTGEACKFARDAKIVVVDIDAIEHSKNSVNIDKLIISDLKEFFLSFTNQKIKEINLKWIEQCNHWKKTFPICEDRYKKSEKIDLYYLTEALSKVLPDNSSFHTDSGLVEVILPNNVIFNSTQRSIHPASQGSMGSALPGIIGAYYVNQNNPVICVTGDGSIMMNLQELETISFNKIPAKIFVINNNAYAVIRKRQQEMFRMRTIGTDPSDGVSCPDFKKVANTFNFTYIKIETTSNLEQKLEQVILTKGPVLCEIMGLEDQNYISNGHAKNSKGHIVARPIEDQSPYLEREVFLKEMIIDPIDQ